MYFRDNEFGRTVGALELIVTSRGPHGWRVEEFGSRANLLGFIGGDSGQFEVQVVGSPEEPYRFATFDGAIDYFAELAWALQLGED